jgi:hypothetical protein
MNSHISFPSIGQFRETVRHIQSGAKYHDVPTPTVTFQGTVKLHGTNFAVCRPINGSADDIFFQSRENIITPLKDNAGSASWGHLHREKFNELFNSIANDLDVSPASVIQIYGEWAGGNIQKGVGLSHIEKSFFVFGIRVSETAESTDWFSSAMVADYMRKGVDFIPNFYHIYQFPVWAIDIDFNAPEQAQNRLIELTNAVEAECPVCRNILGYGFDKPLIGEGIVWTAVGDYSPIKVSGLRFKVKGAAHVNGELRISGLNVPVEIEREIVKQMGNSISTFNFEFID